MEFENVKSENEKLVQIILKFSNINKSFDLLLGKRRQTLDKHGIRFKENNAITYLKSNMLGSRFNLGSNSQKKPTSIWFLMEEHDHMKFACPVKRTNTIGPKWMSS